MSGLAAQFDLKDPEQAKEYLDTLGIEYRFQCYHENIPDGCHRLGDFLEAFRKDYEKARTVFRTNCEDNKHGQSCFKLGNYCMVGRACDKDVGSALEYYRQGCEYGYYSSCHNAALIHQYGKADGNKDYVKAAEFLKKGCDGGNIPSCQSLSTYYIKGKEGVPQDMKKAFDYAQKACDAGHIFGCVNLSVMYLKGEGVAASHAMHEKYKKKAQDLYAGQKDTEKTLEFGKWYLPVIM